MDAVQAQATLTHFSDQAIKALKKSKRSLERSKRYTLAPAIKEHIQQVIDSIDLLIEMSEG